MIEQDSQRMAPGRSKHLSTEQLCGQGGIQSCDVEVKKVPRADSASDILTHPVGESEIKEGLQRMEYPTPDECLAHDPKQCWANHCGIWSLGRRSVA